MADPIISTDPADAFYPNVKEAYRKALVKEYTEPYLDPEVVYQVPKSLADQMRKYGAAPGPQFWTACNYAQRLARDQRGVGAAIGVGNGL